MACYGLHGIVLEVTYGDAAPASGLAALLEDFSFTRLRSDSDPPSIRLRVTLSNGSPALPSCSQELFQQQGLSGYSAEGVFHLTAGCSLFTIRPSEYVGEVSLAQDFFARSRPQQQQFWAFGLLRLLRPLGVFGLHAAAVVTPSGRGLLLVGDSGSGKSTLTLGLVRSGWSYVSDDSVLLRSTAGIAEALALRKPLSIISAEAARYPEFEPAMTPTRRASDRKRRLDLRDHCPERFVPRVRPEILLLCRIIEGPDSQLRPVDAVAGLHALLEQSGLQLMEPSTAGLQLEVLRQLVRQCRIYWLSAGRDLYESPSRLAGLLANCGEGAHGPPHRRAHQPL